jgi:hypothetical protein
VNSVRKKKRRRFNKGYRNMNHSGRRNKRFIRNTEVRDLLIPDIQIRGNCGVCIETVRARAAAG